MKEQTAMDKLVDAVIDEMKNQIAVDDWTAIDELLRFVPKQNLINFLPEEEWGQHA